MSEFAPKVTIDADGEALILRSDAAKMLRVSTNTITATVARGELTDLHKRKGTKKVRLAEVEALKAQREAEAAGESTGSGEAGTDAEKLVSAQKQRQLANVEKYSEKLRAAIEAHVLATTAREACAVIADEFDRLPEWHAPFEGDLTDAGCKVLAEELRDVAAEARRSLDRAAPSARDADGGGDGGEIDPDILAFDFEVDEKATITAIRAVLDSIKTRITQIETAALRGQLIPAQAFRFAVEDIGTVLAMKVQNIRARLVAHIPRQFRGMIRPALTQLAEDLRDRVLDRLPEGPARDAFARGFAVPEDMSISEWAARHRVLSSVSSAEPGRWRNDRTPYLVEIMDAISDDAVREVTCMMASQLGKTEILLNSIGYIIHQQPGPILAMQPDLGMAASVAKDRISPMIDACDPLRDKMEELDEKTTGRAVQQALSRSFPGGGLALVGANAPAALASRPVRYVFADEVDRYAVSAGVEGSPLELAKRRTASFPLTKKIVVTSTPTVKGASLVESIFQRSTQEYLYARCPHCDHAQILRFDQIKFDPETPEAALYQCESEDCGTLWDDAERAAAIRRGVEAGGWVAHNPNADQLHRGFWLNGLYSPFYSHAEIVRDYLNAKDDPAAWRVFVNTVLCESWADDSTNIEEDSITGRVEHFDLDRIPPEVLAVTAGVDVQANRLECQIVGWAEDGTAFALGYFILPGDPQDRDVWDALAEITDAPLAHPFSNGEALFHIDAIAVDSGYQTATVQQWCAERPAKRFAIKGVAGADKAIWKMSTSKKLKAEKGYTLHLVGVDQVKESVFARLQRPVGDPGSIRIGDGIEKAIPREVYAAQMLSEYRTIEFQKTGRTKIAWKQKPGARSEALDSFNYAFAAFQGLISPRADWNARREMLTARPTPAQQPTSTAGTTATDPNALGDLTMPGTGGTGTPAGDLADPNAWAAF